MTTPLQKTLRSGALTILTVATLVSCKDIQKVVDSNSSSSDATAVTTPEISELDQKTAKNNIYIDIYNYQLKSIQRSVNSYLEDFVDDKGNFSKTLPSQVSEKNRRSLGIVSIKSAAETLPKKVAKAMEHSIQLPELDAAAENLAKVVEENAALIEQAHRYYAHDDWKDDKFAEGDKMHPALMEKLPLIAAACEQYDVELRTISDSISKLQLEKMLKEQGRSQAYLTKVFLNEAEVILNHAMSHGVADFNNIDIDLLKKGAADLDALYQELMAKVDADKKADPKNFKHSLNGLVYNKMDNFITAVKETYRRRQEGDVKWTTGELSTMKHSTNPHALATIKGHPVKLLQIYNDIVTNSNRNQ